MNKVREFLKGKKTYIVAAAGILAAVLAYVQDQLTTVQLAEAIFAAIAAATIRAGVTTETAREK